MAQRAKRWLRWGAAVAWAALISYASSLPASKLPGRIPSELGHLGEYFVLGALLYFALRVDLPPGRAIAASVIVASAFGALDEFHQSFVPTRTPDIVDWGLDTLGAWAGASLAAAVAHRAARGAARRPGTPTRQ